MGQSGDYTIIESPSSMITAKFRYFYSICFIYIPMWQLLNIKTICNSSLTYQSAKHYTVLIFSSTKHDHAPQADEAVSNTPLSGDEELDFNTGHVPIKQSTENFSPAIQKNILELGQN